MLCMVDVTSRSLRSSDAREKLCACWPGDDIARGFYQFDFLFYLSEMTFDLKVRIISAKFERQALSALALAYIRVRGSALAGPSPGRNPPCP